MGGAALLSARALCDFSGNFNKETYMLSRTFKFALSKLRRQAEDRRYRAAVWPSGRGCHSWRAGSSCRLLERVPTESKFSIGGHYLEVCWDFSSSVSFRPRAKINKFCRILHFKLTLSILKLCDIHA